MPITKQTIAIIGSSSIFGTSIAKALSRDNYRLLLFDENGEEARILADEITSTEKGADVEFLECTHEACWEADVIFILNKEKNLKDISEKIEDVSIQKIVVTLLNNESVKELEQIETCFPNSKVVGLYPSKNISKDIHLLSRHPKALDTVKSIVSTAGFQPIQKELNTA
jgi:NAD(P)-dependent dehydrogenase (short-subunit alcohol dehydrogenase family)